MVSLDGSQDSERADFLAFKQRLSESDERLPPFDASMRYACLTKNHLVCALKLFRGASTPLVGSEEVIIAPPASDTALRQHLARGVFCEVPGETHVQHGNYARFSACMISGTYVRTYIVALGAVQILGRHTVRCVRYVCRHSFRHLSQVLSSSLWMDDLAAMEKIIVEDNLNANTELATNEMDQPMCARRHASWSTVFGVLRARPERIATRTHVRTHGRLHYVRTYPYRRSRMVR